MTLMICPGQDEIEGRGSPWDKRSNQYSKMIVTVFVHHKHECVDPIVYNVQKIPESAVVAWVGPDNLACLFWVVVDDANIGGIEVELFWKSRCPGWHEHTVVTWGEIIVSAVVELLE